MTAIIQLFLERPANAIILALCVVSLSMFTTIQSISTALAVVQYEQILDTDARKQVLSVQENVVSMQSDIAFMKAQQTTLYNYLLREEIKDEIEE